MSSTREIASFIFERRRISLPGFTNGSNQEEDWSSQVRFFLFHVIRELLDYICCPDEEKTEEFWTYLADRKYDLRPMNEYADFLKGAGFDVKATNMSEWFIEILEMELARLEVQSNPC